MRYKLIELFNKDNLLDFQGKITRISNRNRVYGKRQGNDILYSHICINDLIYQGNYCTEHVWAVIDNDVLSENNIQVGDYIKFSAKVRLYNKNNKNNKKYNYDFNLTKLTNINKVETLYEHISNYENIANNVYKKLKNEKNVINIFNEKYSFLDPLYKRKFKYNGKTYHCITSAFQAQKINDEDVVDEYTNSITNNSIGTISLRLGNLINRREDWDKIKDSEMYNIVDSFFNQNKDLKRLLIKSDKSQIYLHCYNNNLYWGVNKKNKGKNKYGKILMILRDKYDKIRVENLKEEFNNDKKDN